GVGDDFVPVRRPGGGYNAALVADLLVRPEAPADVVVFQHAAKRRDPLVLVLARFAQPHRHVVLIAVIQILANYRYRRIGPVFMERVHRVVVERRSENSEVTIPLRAAENDDVIAIDVANGGDNALI